MATEKDLALLDDYLSNRLSETERVEFENKLEADPDLQKEYTFQQSLLEGIRNARRMELKSMLNKIPVPPVTMSAGEMAAKIIASLLVAGTISGGMYYLLTRDEQPEKSTSNNVEELMSDNAQSIQSDKDSASAELTPILEEPEIEDIPVTPAIKSDKSVTAPSKESLDATSVRERELIKVVSSTFVTSSTEVITDKTHENYHFHYAFSNKKLVLYGFFEQNQYQILEFITAKEHVFFLNYKSNYYLLDDKNTSPTPLVPIKDPQLLKQLKEFRAQ